MAASHSADIKCYVNEVILKLDQTLQSPLILFEFTVTAVDLTIYTVGQTFSLPTRMVVHIYTRHADYTKPLLLRTLTRTATHSLPHVIIYKCATLYSKFL